MDVNAKCEDVLKSLGWTQRRLAEEIGISETSLISARKGRRPLPTHALIRLERLRGTDDHSIIEQLLKTAACVALAAVSLFMTPQENMAYASGAYKSDRNITHILMVLVTRILAAAKHLARTVGGWRALGTA